MPRLPLAAALALAALPALVALPVRAQTAGAAPGTTLRIDAARSTLTYAASHPTHDWRGTSRRVAGTVTLGDGGAIASALVSAPIASFDSGNRNRDANMLETLDAATNPSVAFALARLVPLATPTPDATATAEGTLLFHGVRRPLRVPVRVERLDGGAVRVTGTFPVSMREFSVRAPRLLGVPTRDRLDIRFEIVAR